MKRKGSSQQPPPENLFALGQKSRSQTKSTGGPKVPLNPDIKVTSLGNPSSNLNKAATPTQIVQKKQEDSEQLLLKLEEAQRQNNDSFLYPILIHFLSVLKTNMSDPDKAYFVGLTFVSKKRASAFRDPEVVKILLSFLGRDLSHNVKKSKSLVLLASHLLFRAFVDVPEWPLEFIQVYMEDALSERSWVNEDQTDEYTRYFIDNILTIFTGSGPAWSQLNLTQQSTTSVPPSLKQEEPSSSSSSNQNSGTIMKEEDEMEEEIESKTVIPSLFQQYQTIFPVKNRFPPGPSYERAREYILQVFDSLFKNPNENLRNFIKLLIVGVSYKEIRSRASELLEEWINNPSNRFAKDLFLRIVQCCKESCKEDFNTVVNILKIKVKPAMQQQYFDSLSHLLKSNSDFPAIALRYFLFNEMTQTKTTPQMKVLTIIIKSFPQHQAEMELGSIFQEMALSEPYRYNLKPILKKIYKTLSKYMLCSLTTQYFNFTNELDHEFDSYSFCTYGLMKERTDFSNFDSKEKFPWFTIIVELICLSELLTVPPSLYDSQQNNSLTSEIRNTISKIQTECIKWFHFVVPKYFQTIPSNFQNLFCQMFKKLLFVDNSSVYFSGELTTEIEKNLSRWVTQNISINEDAITRIILMSLNKFLTAAEALDILENLLKRNGDSENSINIQNKQVISAILQLSYYIPPNIRVDKYPQFSVSKLFWQSVSLLVLLASFNVETIGREVWEIPTIKILMEMAITKIWKFPPFESSRESILTKEYELQKFEKEQILLLEKDLILATQRTEENLMVDETNSHLLNQLILHELNGPPRQPPEQIVQKIQLLDIEFKIGRKLSSSRNPDFLLDIMNHQGNNQSMVWLLNPIIQTDPDTLDALPISVLCELFLISHFGTQMFKQLARLLYRLFQFLKPTSPSTSAIEIFQFFLNRLNTGKPSVRDLVKKSLCLLLNSFHQCGNKTLSELENEQLENYSSDWNNYSWIEKFDSLPHFKDLLSSIHTSFLQALQREIHPKALAAYIHYLYTHTASDGIIALALKVSNFLLERTLVVSQLLKNGESASWILKIFTKVVTLVQSQSIFKSDDISVLTIQPPAPVKPFNLHRKISEGIVQLLSFTEIESQLGNSVFSALYDQLVNIFFPVEGTKFFHQKNPISILSTNQAMRLTTSKNPQLIEAGLKCLKPSELVKVISSFGLSIHAVTLILQRLDSASDFIQSQPDNPLLLKRILFYKKLGAKGGENLIQYLESKEKSMQENQDSAMDVESELLKKPDMPPPPAPSSKDHQTCLMLLNQLLNPEINSLGKPSSIDFSPLVFQSFKLISRGDSKFVETIIQTLYQNLLQLKPQTFTALLTQKANISVPLFHSLTLYFQKYQPQTLSELKFHLVTIFQSLVETSLTIHAHLFRQQIQKFLSILLKNHQKVGRASPQVILTETVIEPLSQTPEAAAAQFIQAILDNSPYLEASLQNMFKRLIETKESEKANAREWFLNVLIFVFQFLFSNQEIYERRSHFCGIFLEMLLVINPEISHPLILELMFNKRTDQQTTKLVSSLLSFLLHYGSWKALRVCFDWLLQNKQKIQQIESTVTLDFISAYLHHPRSWTGYAYPELNQTTPSLYHFTPETICVLADHMIQELKENSDKIDPESYPLLPSRVKLLLASARQESQNLYGLVLHLSSSQAPTNVSQPLKASPAHILLIQIYLTFPDLVNTVASQFRGSLVPGIHSSKLDLLLHSVVRRLTDHSTSSGAYIILRKLASLHPSLVMRYLPTIASLLKGRSSMGNTEFIERRYHKLFFHILGILDVLRPQVFKNITFNEEIIPNYLIFLANIHTFNKSFLTLIGKLMDFLSFYIIELNDKSSILQHKQTFLDVAKIFPDIKKTQVIIEVIERISTPESIVGNIPLSPEAIQDMITRLQFYSRKNSQSYDSALLALMELEKEAIRSPMILIHFVDILCGFLKEPETPLRNLAYQLLLRFVHYSPRNAEKIIHSVVANLDSSDVNVSSAALMQGIELFHFGHDHADYLLQSIFIKGRSNAVLLLNLLHECIQFHEVKNV